MNLRSATSTVLAIIVAVSLGLGSASAAEHAPPAPAGPAQTTGQVTAPAGRDGPDLDFLTGYPKEIHTDERMIEEELEFGEAAPHTHWRFHAGTA